MAGVFSRCILARADVVPDNCCADPVVYERVSEEIKSWIWEQAPGVRESLGCPKKEVLETFPPSMRAPQEGCKCGQELGESTNNDSGINRIRGGKKIGKVNKLTDKILFKKLLNIF